MPEEGTTQPNPAPEAQPAPAAAPETNSANTGETQEQKDIKDGRGIAWLSYGGPLAFIPFFAYKQNAWVQKHAKQGLNLFICEGIWVAITIMLSFIKVPSTLFGVTVYTTPWWINLIEAPVSIFFSVIAIIGFVNALSGKFKELPLVGKIKIIK